MVEEQVRRLNVTFTEDGVRLAGRGCGGLRQFRALRIFQRLNGPGWSFGPQHLGSESIGGQDCADDAAWVAFDETYVCPDRAGVGRHELAAWLLNQHLEVRAAHGVFGQVEDVRQRLIFNLDGEVIRQFCILTPGPVGGQFNIAESETSDVESVAYFFQHIFSLRRLRAVGVLSVGGRRSLCRCGEG